MSDTIIWVNGDNLNPSSHVFTKYPDAPAIFVFDERLLAEWNISFKRIVFMYECLLEMPVVIRKGDVVSEVIKFADEHGASDIVTITSPSPRFWQITDEIREQIKHKGEIRVLQEIPLVYSDYEFDLKRFSRFWRKAKPYAMQYK